MNYNYIGPDELIYNNDGGIHSGGFSVNSIMLKNGLSPIMTLNGQQAGGTYNGVEKVSDLFNNLVVPNWGLAYNYRTGGGIGERNFNKDKSVDEDDVIEEKLHERLMNLIKVNEDDMKGVKEMKEPTNKKKITRKYTKSHKNNNTKKYYNKYKQSK
jgi:hypothetical protein